MKRGDVQTEESTADELDSIWKAHGNTAEAEWKEACLWIADCVAEWPKDSSQPNTCSAATLSLIPQPNTGPADKNPE